MEMLPFLERFQTAIVGVIGFAGVILTLLANAWIARRQDRDRREHERVALERALLAELQHHTATMEQTTERLQETFERLERDPEAEAVAMYHAHFPTPIFDANIPRLGLLPAAVLPAVLDIYATLKQSELSISHLSQLDESGMYRVVRIARDLQVLVGVLRSTGEQSRAAADRLRASIGSGDVTTGIRRDPADDGR